MLNPSPPNLHTPTAPQRCWWRILLTIFALGLPLIGAQAALRITLLGLDQAQHDNVRQYLGLRADSPPKSEIHLRRLFRQAPEEIRRALQALGYYQPEITADLRQHGKDWEAHFTIRPGEPVRIIALDLNIEPAPGETDPAIQKLLTVFPLRRNDVLHHGQYTQGKHDWQVFAEERGYFDARFTTQRIAVDPEKHSAEVHLHYALGKRYRFGAVRFQQQGYKADYLARFVPFKPDDPYFADRLLELRTRLENSDHFSGVEVNAWRERAKDYIIPVDVMLIKRPKFAFSTGFGYGTDTGPRLSLGWENRRINSAGHRFSNTLTLSGISSGASALYSIPLRDPAREHLEFLASGLNESTDTADSRTITLGARRTKVRTGNWLETLFLNAEQESFQVGSDSGIARLLLPGINWARLRNRSGAYLQSGDRLFFELKGSDTWLGSDTRFLQAQTRGKLIEALNSNSRVLLRMDLGASVVGTFNELPASQRFFAGGDRSVRGYDFESLGPKDADGAVTGGRYLVVGSLEYERRIHAKWSVAAFYDLGNALDTFTDPLKHSAGLGLRWQTPVGPIRVDLASALDEPDRPLRLHLYFGPDL